MPCLRTTRCSRGLSAAARIAFLSIAATLTRCSAPPAVELFERGRLAASASAARGPVLPADQDDEHDARGAPPRRVQALPSRPGRRPRTPPRLRGASSSASSRAGAGRARARADRSPGPPTTATSSGVGSSSVGWAITSSSPTAATMMPATKTTWRYVNASRAVVVVVGELEAPFGDPRDVAEVEPPERRGRDERERERGHARGIERQLGRGRARDHDRLAERDDDEELEPLREVRRLHLPRGRRQLRPPGHPVEEERRRVVDRERDEPERDPRRAGGEPTRDPEDPGGKEPDQDVQRRLALGRAADRRRRR